MKKIIKKILINSIGAITLFCFKRLVKKDHIYVINYHSTYPEFNENFVKQINLYKKYFEIISVDEILKNKKSNKPKLIITFDDGHVSNFQAAQILKKNHVNATFFIPFNFIFREVNNDFEKEFLITTKKFNILSNKKLDKKNNYKKLSLNIEDLLKLKNMNFEIGCHTMNHIRLGKNLEKDILYEEIVTSKSALEKKLDITIKSFAWVIGDLKSYSFKAAKLIKENYKFSFMTCCKSFELEKDDFQQIHRFNIENFFTLKEISFVLSGLYEFMYLKKRNKVNKMTLV